MVSAVLGLLNGLEFEVIVDNVAPRAFAGSSRGFRPRTIDGANLHFAYFLFTQYHQAAYINCFHVDLHYQLRIVVPSTTCKWSSHTAPVMRLIACILVEQAAEYYPLSQELGFRSAT